MGTHGHRDYFRPFVCDSYHFTFCSSDVSAVFQIRADSTDFEKKSKKNHLFLEKKRLLFGY